MKQQCHMTFIYLSWLIYVAGLVYLVLGRDYPLALSWLIFVPLVQWTYVRYFPSLSRYMGYGRLVDEPTQNTSQASVKVTLYVGLGCPFCPVIRQRLLALQDRMGFQLEEVDVTLRPQLLIDKGIRAVPVVEAGTLRVTGNATSQQLSTLISKAQTVEASS
jgi:hypothetical protein